MPQLPSAPMPMRPIQAPRLRPSLSCSQLNLSTRPSSFSNSRPAICDAIRRIATRRPSSSPGSPNPWQFQPSVNCGGDSGSSKVGGLPLSISRSSRRLSDTITSPFGWASRGTVPHHVDQHRHGLRLATAPPRRIVGSGTDRRRGSLTVRASSAVRCNVFAPTPSKDARSLGPRVRSGRARPALRALKIETQSPRCPAPVRGPRLVAAPSPRYRVFASGPVQSGRPRVRLRPFG